jgi:predicted DNA-binding transcriptional regulator YafY
VLTATVADTGELRWWILGFGSQFRVESPARLRKELAAAASQT